MSSEEICARIDHFLAMPDGQSSNLDAPRRLDKNLPKSESWTLRQLLSEVRSRISAQGG